MSLFRKSQKILGIIFESALAAVRRSIDTMDTKGSSQIIIIVQIRILAWLQVRTRSRLLMCECRKAQEYYLFGICKILSYLYSEVHNSLWIICHDVLWRFGLATNEPEVVSWCMCLKEGSGICIFSEYARYCRTAKYTIAPWIMSWCIVTSQKLVGPTVQQLSWCRSLFCKMEVPIIIAYPSAHAHFHGHVNRKVAF